MVQMLRCRGAGTDEVQVQDKAVQEVQCANVLMFRCGPGAEMQRCRFADAF
jgi:hypothetical protein